MCNLLLLFLILYFLSLSLFCHTEVPPSSYCCFAPCSSSTCVRWCLHGADPPFSVIITPKSSSYFASEAVLILCWIVQKPSSWWLFVQAGCFTLLNFIQDFNSMHFLFLVFWVSFLYALISITVDFLNIFVSWYIIWLHM